MSSEMQERIALAMAEKRREFIGRPLKTIWPDLAIAAMEAMREPTGGMCDAILCLPLPLESWVKRAVFTTMIDHEINLAEGDGDA